jgi:hypothetical protein
VQTQKHASLTLVPLAWSPAGQLSAPLPGVRKPSRRAHLKHSIPWLDRPDSYGSGLPMRTLAVHFAGMMRPILCKSKKLLTRFENPCDVPSDRLSLE